MKKLISISVLTAAIVGCQPSSVVQPVADEPTVQPGQTDGAAIEQPKAQMNIAFSFPETANASVIQNDTTQLKFTVWQARASTWQDAFPSEYFEDPVQSLSPDSDFSMVAETLFERAYILDRLILNHSKPIYQITLDAGTNSASVELPPGNYFLNAEQVNSAGDSYSTGNMLAELKSGRNDVKLRMLSGSWQFVDENNQPTNINLDILSHAITDLNGDDQADKAIDQIDYLPSANLSGITFGQAGGGVKLSSDFVELDFNTNSGTVTLPNTSIWDFISTYEEYQTNSKAPYFNAVGVFQEYRRDDSSTASERFINESHFELLSVLYHQFDTFGHWDETYFDKQIYLTTVSPRLTSYTPHSGDFDVSSAYSSAYYADGQSIETLTARGSIRSTIANDNNLLNSDGTLPEGVFKPATVVNGSEITGTLLQWLVDSDYSRPSIIETPALPDNPRNSAPPVNFDKWQQAFVTAQALPASTSASPFADGQQCTSLTNLENYLNEANYVWLNDTWVPGIVNPLGQYNSELQAYEYPDLDQVADDDTDLVEVASVSTFNDTENSYWEEIDYTVRSTATNWYADAVTGKYFDGSNVALNFQFAIYRTETGDYRRLASASDMPEGESCEVRNELYQNFCEFDIPTDTNGDGTLTFADGINQTLVNENWVLNWKATGSHILLENAELGVFLAAIDGSDGWAKNENGIWQKGEQQASVHGATAEDYLNGIDTGLDWLSEDITYYNANSLPEYYCNNFFDLGCTVNLGDHRDLDGDGVIEPVEISTTAIATTSSTTENVYLCWQDFRMVGSSFANTVNFPEPNPQPMPVYDVAPVTAVADNQNGDTTGSAITINTDYVTNPVHELFKATPGYSETVIATATLEVNNGSWYEAPSFASELVRNGEFEEFTTQLTSNPIDVSNANFIELAAEVEGIGAWQLYADECGPGIGLQIRDADTDEIIHSGSAKNLKVYLKPSVNRIYIDLREFYYECGPDSLLGKMAMSNVRLTLKNITPNPLTGPWLLGFAIGGEQCQASATGEFYGLFDVQLNEPAEYTFNNDYAIAFSIDENAQASMTLTQPDGTQHTSSYAVPDWHNGFHYYGLTGTESACEHDFIATRYASDSDYLYEFENSDAFAMVAEKLVRKKPSTNTLIIATTDENDVRLFNAINEGNFLPGLTIKTYLTDDPDAELDFSLDELISYPGYDFIVTSNPDMYELPWRARNVTLNLADQPFSQVQLLAATDYAGELTGLPIGQPLYGLSYRVDALSNFTSVPSNLAELTSLLNANSTMLAPMSVGTSNLFSHEAFLTMLAGTMSATELEQLLNGQTCFDVANWQTAITELQALQAANLLQSGANPVATSIDDYLDEREIAAMWLRGDTGVLLGPISYQRLSTLYSPVPGNGSRYHAGNMRTLHPMMGGNVINQGRLLAFVQTPAFAELVANVQGYLPAIDLPSSSNRTALGTLVETAIANNNISQDITELHLSTKAQPAIDYYYNLNNLRIFDVMAGNWSIENFGYEFERFLELNGVPMCDQQSSQQ
ncbi:hypothetical protein [Salinibius halmophilus]|uniref:hypothetical protein n=1 Tax=Salinibius halmophilus TaxID=1853216 RepID=UPI000E667312|nr:hypothetical protein [Salinibius halmophilus]